MLKKAIIETVAKRMLEKSGNKKVNLKNEPLAYILKEIMNNFTEDELGYPHAVLYSLMDLREWRPENTNSIL